MTVERERPVTSITSVRVSARPSRISRSTPPGEPSTADMVSATLSARLRHVEHFRVNRYAEVRINAPRGNLLLAKSQRSFGYARSSLREEPEEGRVARALLLEGPRTLRLREEAAPGLGPAGDPRPGARQRHQPRHRAQPLPRHLGLRRPRRSTATCAPSSARPAPPGVPRHAGLRARRHRRRGRRRGSRAPARRPRPRRRAAPRRGGARPGRGRRLDLPAGPPPGGRAARALAVRQRRRGGAGRRARRAHQARRPRRRDRPGRDRAAARADGAARGRAAHHARSTRWLAAASSRSSSAPTRRSTRRRRRPARRSSAPPAAPTWRSRPRAPRPACTTRSPPRGSAAPSSPSASTRAARAELRLGEEWHHNRLEMVSSMGAWGAPHRAYPAWDRPRVMRTVVDLLASGALRVDGAAGPALPVRAGRRGVRLARCQPERGGQGGAHLRRLHPAGGER